MDKNWCWYVDYYIADFCDDKKLINKVDRLDITLVIIIPTMFKLNAKIKLCHSFTTIQINHKEPSHTPSQWSKKYNSKCYTMLVYIHNTTTLSEFISLNFPNFPIKWKHFRLTMLIWYHIWIGVIDIGWICHKLWT